MRARFARKSSYCGFGALLFGSLGVGVVLAGTGRTEAPVNSEAPPLPAERAAETLGRLPLRFEANAGQTHPDVQFLSRGQGYALFLTSDEAVLSLRAPKRGTREPKPETLRLKLAGANPRVAARGVAELPGRTNYFFGSDPKKWRRNVRQYAKVQYDDVYPGVDVVYYGAGQQLEYDFVVAPGADPDQIRLQFQGAKRVQLADNGDLLLHGEGGEVRQHKPVVYQEIDGQRRQVDGDYVLLASNKVGFELAAYDASRPLVIDPVVTYATYIGGSDADSRPGIAVDNAGSVYVVGETLSTNFPTTAGVLKTTGGRDLFVTKLDASGVRLAYSTYLGGSRLDGAHQVADSQSAVAVDGLGNVYVTGSTESSDFPITAGVVQNAKGGGGVGQGDDAFVAKLDSTGSSLVYSTYLGGSQHDAGSGIAVDTAGNAYVTGDTASTDFPTTSGTFQRVKAGAAGTTDVFVSKLNPSGTTLVYSTFLGGEQNEATPSIAVDANGNAYVTGSTQSTNFPTQNAIQTGAGTDSGFITKLNAAGTAQLYSTYLGGSTFDRPMGIAVDTAGNAHVTGKTSSTDFPTLRPIQGTNRGQGDAFVLGVNPTGSAFLYSTFLGGSGRDEGRAIAVDSTGNIYVTGSTTSANFPSSNAIQTSFAGGTDVFVTKLNPTASAFLYSTFLGGSGGGTGIPTAGESATSIAVDRTGNAYVAGFTPSLNFPTKGAAQPDYGGGTADIFVVKIADGGGGGSTPVLAPSNLTARAVADDQVVLTFTDNSDNETGFEVERKTGTLAYAVVGAVGSDVTTFTDTATSARTTYSYRVRAIRETGAPGTPGTPIPGSAYSNEVTTTTPDAPQAPPTTPGSLSAVAVSSTQVDLIFADLSDDETGFEIQRRAGSGPFRTITMLPSGVNTYTDAGLVGNVTYTYRVRALNDGGESTFSSEAVTTTFRNPPAAPSNLKATVASSTQVDLTWSDNSADETSFSLERRSNGTQFEQVAVLSPDERSYSDTTVSGNTTYTYRLQSVNSGGGSAYSNAAVVSTRTATSQAGRLSASITDIDFEDVEIGDTVTRTFRIRNVGQAALRVSIGRLRAPFSVSPSGNGTIRPGKGVTVRVRFKPTTTRTTEAELEISSNDPETGTLLIPITGRGTD